MKSILLIYLILASLLSSFGQTKTLTGSVFFKEDNTPAFNTHIFIKGTGYGTTANEDGKFELRLPEGYSDDTLAISFMGYLPEYVVVEQFENDQKVHLLSDKSLLDEVMVSPDSGVYIIQKVLKNLPKNYPKRKRTYDVHYKEVVTNDREYTRFLEAGAEINAKGFYNKSMTPKDLEIQINGKRGVEKPDARLMDENRIFSNGIVTVFLVNWFRQDLDKKEQFNYVFELAGHTIFEGRPVYHVTMYSPRVYKMEGVKVYDHIYITKDTYAVVAVRYQEDWGETPSPLNDKNGPPNNQVVLNIDFHEIEGKWYLSYIRDYRRKVFVGDSSQAADRTIRVLNVSKPKKLDRGEQMHWHTDIFNYPVAFDSGFWQNFNAPLMSEEEKKVREAISSQNRNLELEKKNSTGVRDK